MSGSSSATGFFYFYIAIILLILLRLIRRTIRNYRGTGFSLGMTYFSAFLYSAIGVVFLAISFAGGVNPQLAVLEVGLAAVAAFASFKLTDRRLKLWKTPEGSFRIRGGVEIYLIYLVGLITRLSIYIYVGPSIFALTSGNSLGGTALYGSMVADLVLTLGVGLMLGKYLRSVRKYHRILQGKDTP